MASRFPPKLKTAFFLMLTGILVTSSVCLGKVRVKDVTRLKNTSKHTLVGYGLVVGLNGTGDSDEALTQRTISNLLENFHIKINRDNLVAENTAAVMVSADVKSSAHKGDHIPATISSIGDADSLKGGELLLTPLLDNGGDVAATAQGAVTTGGFSYGGDAGGGGQTVQRNHPTVGMLTNGAKLKRDFGDRTPGDDGKLVFYLDNPDYTTASNMAAAINDEFPGAAFAEGAGTVRINVPQKFVNESRVPEFISQAQQITFKPDNKAKVVFNERTGTIVFGKDVQISKAAVSHGNITIRVTNREAVIQPPALSEGETETQQAQETEVEEEDANISVLPSTSTVGDLVAVLNTLGVTPRDTMVILHVLREAGALHAELKSL